MIKPDKGLMGQFAARVLAPKVAGERAQLSMKGAGGDRGERGDLKQYWKERSKEIAAFKREDGKEATLEKANYFLEREEESMRAMWRKRRR